MGIIDHDEGAELFGEADDLWKWRDVSIHTEDTVCDDHDFASASRFLQHAAQPGYVFVWVDLAGRSIETNAVDDAGVIEFVANNDVFGKYEGRDDAKVGGIA